MSPGADRLPAEMLQMIFSYLPCEDLVESVQFVCTTWQQAFRQMSLWKHIMYKPDSRNENVAQRLKILPQMRILNLIDATVDSDLIQFMTDSCPNLEHLYIHWDTIYFNTNVPTTRPLSQIKILSLFRRGYYRVDFPYLDSVFPNLKSLNIAELSFDRKDLEHYLEKKQDSLRTLSVPCCTEDKLCVLPCLSVCTKLRNLTLDEVCDEVRSWKEVEHLPNIKHLTLYDSDMSNLNASSPVFCSFPNITTLVLDHCSTSTDFFYTIARNCPRLQKLKLFSYGLEMEDTLHALPLERLSHLCIHKSPYLTDEVIENIVQLMPQLTHLDLYKCGRVTTGCLKLICGISKLKVLKFDLKHVQLPVDLRACDVNNKDLKLMFYNCPDVSYLDAMRQQHLRVCLTRYSKRRMDRYHFRQMSGHSWIKHGCLWCINGQCSNSTDDET